MNKKVSIGVAVTLALIAMTVTFSITMVLSMRMFDNTISSISEKENLFSTLSEINTYVASTDYYDVSYDTVYDTTASGYILGTGDKYARYYTAKAFAEYQDLQSNRIMGIGVNVAKDSSSGYARIIRVYNDSPASELGLQVGGYILSITGTDGVTTEVKNLSDADSILSRLRGEEGTTTTINYMDTNGEIHENLEITHTSYTVNTITSQMVGDSCGYIKISSFNSNSPSELDSAINELLTAGAASLVIDLRDNTGGTLSHAYACADRVTPEGVLAYSQDKNGNQTILASSDTTKVNVPMVCLVNGNTAAGAELFASCVQNLCGGKVVGLTSAGKGTIQGEPQRMSNGSAVVVTVGQLLTYNREGSLYCFEGTGIVPDVEATLTAEEEQNYYNLTPDTDSQIKTAVSTANSMAGVSSTSSTAPTVQTAPSAPVAEAPQEEAPAEEAPAEEAPAEEETTEE